MPPAPACSVSSKTRSGACKPVTLISVPLVPEEETAETLALLYRQGKIQAIGVSNSLAQELERFLAVAPLHTVQPPYNLFERAIERAVLPYARRHHLSTLTYGALCRGLPSGKMRPDTRFTGDDLRQTGPKFRPLRYAQYLRAVEHWTAWRTSSTARGSSTWPCAGRWTSPASAWRSGG